MNRLKILIIGDTHVSEYRSIPNQIQEYIDKHNWIIHVGDYTSESLIRVLRDKKRDKFVGVYGNSDPMSVRDLVKSKELISIGGKIFGICHPWTGGSEGDAMRKVKKEFNSYNLDYLVFGHTHDSLIRKEENLTLINPGRGYIEDRSFGPPCSIISVEISDKIEIRIKKINY